MKVAWKTGCDVGTNTGMDWTADWALQFTIGDICGNGFLGPQSFVIQGGCPSETSTTSEAHFETGLALSAKESPHYQRKNRHTIGETWITLSAKHPPPYRRNSPRSVGEARLALSANQTSHIGETRLVLSVKRVSFYRRRERSLTS
jgi:hypothetical protein